MIFDDKNRKKEKKQPIGNQNEKKRFESITIQTYLCVCMFVVDVVVFLFRNEFESVIFFFYSNVFFPMKMMIYFIYYTTSNDGMFFLKNSILNHLYNQQIMMIKISILIDSQSRISYDEQQKKNLDDRFRFTNDNKLIYEDMKTTKKILHFFFKFSPLYMCVGREFFTKKSRQPKKKFWKHEP